MENRLASEKSPYLLQHAHNPVDWYPWGEDAFEKAEIENKPVFLSIGYSTCHWCHVMAHESFEDEEVAGILNRGFISIKVDREERPDIDSVYMTVCQTLTGSGGWPLTIIMTPEKEPFFAGTYFPKTGRGQSAGLTELLDFVAKTWKNDKRKLTAEGRKVTAFMRENLSRANAKKHIDSAGLIRDAINDFRQSFDSEWGGFGPMPKFPSPHNLLFLLAQKDAGCRQMAEKTLVQMYRGGIFDHIGGGFCRYSTDDRWLVPHFEKMLYDNALLILAYSEAFARTGNTLYTAIIEKTARYVLRELTDDAGGFYCSQDADSDGEEGKFYVFVPGEIIEALGQKEGEAFCRRFDITPKGNFEGKSIPNRIKDTDYEQTEDDDNLEKLALYRKKRTGLHRDDKILTGWNGLMIASLARSARILDRTDYLDAAEKAAAFIWNHLYKDGRLQVRWRQGQAAYEATLDDYAFFAWGLLECYGSTFRAEYLKKAVQLGEQLINQFFDPEEGGCFLYGKDSEQLIIRPKENYDGAMPSGNSAAALVMDKLAFLTGKELWRTAAAKQRDFMEAGAQQRPRAHSFFLWQLSKTKKAAQLICVTKSGAPVKELRKLDMDILVKTDDNRKTLEEEAPFMNDYPIPHNGADYYFCEGHSCRSPVHSLSELKKLLAECGSTSIQGKNKKND